jgi:hypothetical protein
MVASIPPREEHRFAEYHRQREFTAENGITVSVERVFPNQGCPDRVWVTIVDEPNWELCAALNETQAVRLARWLLAATGRIS